MMSQKEIYAKSLQAELHIIDREIEYFEGQLAALPAHKYAAFKAKLDQIKQHRAKVHLMFVQVQSSNESNWEQLQGEFKELWTRLLETIRNAK